MKIAVTGSHGLIGSALVPVLERQGHQVIRLVRSTPAENEVRWDPTEGGIDASGLDGCEAVVHLAGESVVGRWTRAKRDRIRKSRVAGTRLLCGALAALAAPPRVVVMASGVGYYGADGVVDEGAPPGEGFLAQVCVAWEGAAAAAVQAGIRVVPMRLGMVLAGGGGALAKMLPVFRWGLGGVLGSGRQQVSWVAIGDVLRVVEFVLANDKLTGPVNVSAPGHVTNREFTRTLACVLRRWAPWRVPAFALRLAYGRMADEMLLTGIAARPARLLDAGFRFGWPDLEGALRHVLGRGSSAARTPVLPATRSD
jgi:uncharacterized protein (TIGR01777 family)